MANNKKLLIVAATLLVLGFLGIAITSWFFCRNQTIDKTFSSLGKKIYFTGRGENAKLISFSDGPHWLGMHGGSCANCHGENGKGGFQIEMTDEVAPDIRWDILLKANNGHKKEAADDKHKPYNEKSLKRAITRGLDPSGEKLDSIMPRWNMNNIELESLIKYLKTLQ